jgi:hypothetical protein
MGHPVEGQFSQVWLVMSIRNVMRLPLVRSSVSHMLKSGNLSHIPNAKPHPDSQLDHDWLE